MLLLPNVARYPVRQGHRFDSRGTAQVDIAAAAAVVKVVAVVDVMVVLLR